MIDLTRFRNTFAYYFTDSQIKLIECSCNLSLCERHLEGHCIKFGCYNLFSFTVYNRGEAQILETADIENIDTLENRIKVRFETGFQSDDYQECVHIYTISEYEKNFNEELKCESCS